MNFTKIRNQINMALTGSSTNRRKRRSLTENAFGISAGNVTTEHIEGSENTFSFESNGKTITGFLEKRDNGTIDAVVVCGSYDVVKGASKSEIVEKIRSAASKLCGVAEDVLLPPENKARGSKEISEAERNWAEHDKQLRENPTLEQAEGRPRVGDFPRAEEPGRTGDSTMAKIDALTVKRWHNKALQWLLANSPEVLPAKVLTGRDAWTIAHRCGITDEAYRDRSVVDAHIQTALERIFPNAVFKDAKRY